MSHSRKLIVPALLALGVFAAAPIVSGLTGAVAGGQNNTGFKVSGLAPGGGGDTTKNGGGDGGTTKNGGGDGGTTKNGGGNGGTTKNGGGGGDHGGHRHGGGDGDHFDHRVFTFGGGGGDSVEHGRMTCIVNGRIIPARSVSECRYGPGFVYHGDSYFGGGYVQRRVVRRHFGYDVGMPGPRGDVGYGGGYTFGSGAHGYAHGDVEFGFGGSVYVGSNAAVMQAKRRAREGSHGFGAYGVDGGYAVGYGFNQGFNAEYGMQQNGYGYAKHYRHSRHGKRLRHQGYMGGYEFGGGAGGCGCYDPGYVVHYGPTISKDGGY